MDPIATKLLLDEICKLGRRFDESIARLDRLHQLAGGRSPSSCTDCSSAIAMDALVTSSDPDASLNQFALNADQKLVRCVPVNIECHPTSELLRPASEKGVSIAPIVAIGSELPIADLEPQESLLKEYSLQIQEREEEHMELEVDDKALPSINSEVLKVVSFQVDHSSLT